MNTCEFHWHDDLAKEVSALKAENDKLILQNDALRKYYDWSMDAGSWSDVGQDAKDGTRWIISVEESKEMERLMTNVDALLNPSTYGAQQPEKTNPLKRVRPCAGA